MSMSRRLGPLHQQPTEITVEITHPEHCAPERRFEITFGLYQHDNGGQVGVTLQLTTDETIELIDKIKLASLAEEARQK